MLRTQSIDNFQKRHFSTKSKPKVQFCICHSKTMKIRVFSSKTQQWSCKIDEKSRLSLLGGGGTFATNEHLNHLVVKDAVVALIQFKQRKNNLVVERVKNELKTQLFLSICVINEGEKQHKMCEKSSKCFFQTFSPPHNWI